MNKRKWLLIVACITMVVLFGAGLALAQTPDGAMPNPPTDHKSFRTMDDLLVEVGSKVPEFGGMFLDPEENVLNVYLLNHGKAAEVEQAIKEVFGPERIPDGGIHILQGQHSMAQLKQWYDAMQNVFQIPGVTGTDILEDENRLWIGVEEMEIRGAVEKEIKRLGIPHEVVAVVEFGPIIGETTVRDAVRPDRRPVDHPTRRRGRTEHS